MSVINSQPVQRLLRSIPAPAFLWLAVLISGAASSVTRKLTQIGEQHLTNGHNPISLCNVLFVGNLCALLVLISLNWQQINSDTLRQISRREWIYLVIVATLSGALAPGLIFQALALTGVNNIVLIGRIEPPLILGLGMWFLKERVNVWQILGAIVAFSGVILTIALQPIVPRMMVMESSIGKGELLAAIGAIALAMATIISKKYLSHVPLGIYSITRNVIGTIIFFFTAMILYGRNHFMEALSPFLWQWMLVYSAVIVVVGQSCWIHGLRLSTVSTAAIVGSFVPIAGILAAYWVLGEVPTQAQYIGGTVILVGIFLSQVGLRRQMQSAVTMSAINTLNRLESEMGFKGI